MPTDQEWIATATGMLQETGRRAGGARSEVIGQLAKESCAVSVEQLEIALSQQGRKVGRASIYRALEALAELDLVQRVELGEAGSRWERSGAGSHHHHHHLLCTSCGSVVPFEDDALEKALHSLGDRNGYELDAHDVTLHGRCPSCATMKSN